MALEVAGSKPVTRPTFFYKKQGCNSGTQNPKVGKIVSDCVKIGKITAQSRHNKRICGICAFNQSGRAFDAVDVCAWLAWH